MALQATKGDENPNSEDLARGPVADQGGRPYFGWFSTVPRKPEVRESMWVEGFRSC
jgi:hypothetical protein